MSEYRLEYSFEETVHKMTEEVQRKVDQEILDANAHVLEEFGYVKVVRCSDCAKWHYFDDEDGVRYGECDEWKRADSHCMPATREDGYCAWAKRKEGGDD